MAMQAPANAPLVCHGHSRPINHLEYSNVTEDGVFLISSSKGTYNLICRTHVIPGNRLIPRQPFLFSRSNLTAPPLYTHRRPAHDPQRRDG